MREHSLDELAKGLASGSLSRRKVVYATGGYREVYEQLQLNAGEKRSRIEEVIDV